MGRVMKRGVLQKTGLAGPLFFPWACTLVEVLQSDINTIDSCCKECQMSLNHSKCGLLRITRNSQPIHYSYNVEANLIKTTNKQKDIGFVVSKDLKWSLNVQAVSNKADKMLGFVKTSCFHASDPKVRKTLYLTLVRSQLHYCSQVWAPQTFQDIQTLERVQRRSMKFIIIISSISNRYFIP
jgi:hypothetical protein